MNHIKLFLLGFMLVGLSVLVQAQQPDAVLLNQLTEVKITAGKKITITHFDIVINNRAGERFCDVDIPYSKISSVSNIEATIKSLHGAIIKKLNKADIKNRSAISDISLYEDNMVKEFTLKHNVYPYVLSYSYKVQEQQFLFVEYWVPVLERNVPTVNANLSISVPIDYKIKFSNRNFVEFNADTINSTIVFSWKAKYNGVPDMEIFGPDIQTYLPVVKVVPSNFLYKNKGSFDSWELYGNWQAKINSHLQELPANEKLTINSLLAGVTDQQEKIKKLYHYLQDETRYINVSIETGGMIPYPASYVAENKFGDCKALSNYFRAVLDFAGIKSYYSKVYADNVIKPMDKSFPSQQSNHIILCVPTENDTIWLDCTSKGPFNYLGTFTQGRDALVINEFNSHFVQTPALKPNDVKELRKIKIQQLTEKQAQVDFETINKGEKFDQLLQLNKQFRDESQKTIIRNNFVESGFELADYQIQQPHRDSTFIIFNYQTKSNKLFQQYGNELITRTIPFELPRFSKLSERKYPVQIDFPICKTDSQTYIIDSKYKIRSIPEDKIITSEYGLYTFHVQNTNNEVTITKTFLLNSLYVELDKYINLYNFIKKVTDFENSAIIVSQLN